MDPHETGSVPADPRGTQALGACTWPPSGSVPPPPTRRERSGEREKAALHLRRRRESSYSPLPVDPCPTGPPADMRSRQVLSRWTVLPGRFPFLLGNIKRLYPAFVASCRLARTRSWSMHHCRTEMADLLALPFLPLS